MDAFSRTSEKNQNQSDIGKSAGEEHDDKSRVNLVSLQHAGHRQTSCPEMDETPSHWQPALPVLRTSADFMPLCRRSGRPFRVGRSLSTATVAKAALGM
jgi:hypothetical protein